jgi:hypothetical protein
MSERRRFLKQMTALAASSCAAVGCGPGHDSPPKPDADGIELALAELNRAAEIGISPDEFERAKAYAAGAYRAMQSNLRPIVLDPALDLPVTFSAKGGSR